jgi:Cd2+/Zn2+-exporting ATPase
MVNGIRPHRALLPPLWNKDILPLALALVFLATGVIVKYTGAGELICLPLFISAIILGGAKVIRKALSVVRRFSLDMNFLMLLATVGAVALQRWEEAAAVMVLFALSEVVEERSRIRSRHALHSLMELAPPVAVVLEGGKEAMRRVEEISVGNRILVRPGERVPLDGVVTEGRSSVNQSSITGESIPVPKGPGDEVFAGTLNDRGTLEIVITRESSDSVLAQVVALVENARSDPASIQRFSERFARYYTPAVVSLATVIAFGVPVFLGQPFSVWLYRALVLLIISCPCALVISVPVTILLGLTVAARKGVIIKGGRVLETMGEVRAIAFDKTGTLTHGEPRITDVISFGELGRDEIISLAAVIEAKSEHHLAGAFTREPIADSADRASYVVEHFDALPGRGVVARVNGKTYLLGNHAMAEEHGICSPDAEEQLRKFEGEGKTTVFVGTSELLYGIIALTDDPRSESLRSIEELRSEGIEKIIIITGDNQGTARAIGDRVGIADVFAEVLPGDKVRLVRDLQEKYGIVAMVGDGINDAPALAAASVGIAMGVAGTDIAAETADVILMSDDMTKVPLLYRLSKTVLAILKQNIILALGIKLAVMVLGLAGISTLWMAILADDGATFLVLLNAFRITRVGRDSR